MVDDLKTYLDAFASTICDQRIGLVHHHPERTSQQTQCFANVKRKIRACGGRERFGWMFHYRVVPSIGGLGYLIAVHHSIWNSPNGALIDVTPFHIDSKHHPLTVEGSVLFLLDFLANPIKVGDQLAPLPSRFFPLNSDERLITHVFDLAKSEEAECAKIYKSRGLGSE